MNKKVQEFIVKMKEEEKRQKDEFLVSLGLVDETKKTILRKYISYHHHEAKIDESNDLSYIESEVNLPLELTDEEYQEVLKYSAFRDIKVEGKGGLRTTWANTISIMANVLLVINIIGGFFFWVELMTKSSTSGFAWISIVVVLLYCMLFFPLLKGFSKVVALAELKLQKQK